MLGPLINRVLEDKSLQISTSPVEIYKHWVNQVFYFLAHVIQNLID